jgi:hypothetical protein
MRRSPRGASSSYSGSLHSYNASNARALLTCYAKAKPRPSKWDDAHKWLSRAPDDGHGRRRSSGAHDRLLLPSASHKGSSVGGEVPATDAGGLAEGDTKRVVDPVRVSGRQRCVPLSMRNVGTEMTPAGSKEPSRTNTPRPPRRSAGPSSGRFAEKT